MAYVAAAIVGFVGFIVATWCVLAATDANVSSETALQYMLIAAICGAATLPLALWRWRARKGSA